MRLYSAEGAPGETSRMIAQHKLCALNFKYYNSFRWFKTNRCNVINYDFFFHSICEFKCPTANFNKSLYPYVKRCIICPTKYIPILGPYYSIITK